MSRTLSLYDLAGLVSILAIPSHASRDEAVRIGRAAVQLASDRGWGVEYTSDEPLPIARAFVAAIRESAIVLPSTHTGRNVAHA